MREQFTLEWANAMVCSIENSVRKNFPEEIRSWPILQSSHFDAYDLSKDYMALILIDKLSGGRSGDWTIKPFPHTGLPALPPKVKDIELWQFFLRSKLALREDDAAFLIPKKDSGENSVLKHYDLFSAEEQFFWSCQLEYVVCRHNEHIKSMKKQELTQPNNITYNVNGTGARLNINTNDSSINVIGSEVSKIFAQVRDAVNQIQDPAARCKIDSALSEMERAHGSSAFLKKYQEFITSAANHMTVLAPIIPALTGLLT